MESTSVSAELYSVLCGHTGDINCCAWSPTNKGILCSCGGGDKSLRIWNIPKSANTDDSTLLHTIPAAHKYYVNACVYNPSGDLLATASSDETVKLWSTASWTTVGELVAHEEGVKWCCFSPDGNLLATASDDETVRVWEVSTLKCITTFSKSTSSATCCIFAPNGWLVVTGTSSGELLLFNAFTGKRLNRILGAHDMGLNSMVLDPASAKKEDDSLNEDGFSFASAGIDAVVRIWSVKCNNKSEANKSVTATVVAELAGHSGPVYSVAYHPSLGIIASGSADKSVILWDLESKKQVLKLEAHNRYVIHVSFSPCGSYLTSASSDRTIKVWRIHSKAAGENGSEEGEDSKEPEDESLSPAQPSVISTTKWSIEEVCQWAETVAEQQEKGQQGHPDDLRAAERLSLTLEQLLASHVDKPGGEDLKCPITCEVMRDPVLAADGYSYERTAIIGWFSKGRRTSPVTNLPLTNTLLLPNRVLKTIIDRDRNDTPNNGTGTCSAPDKPSNIESN